MILLNDFVFWDIDRLCLIMIFARDDIQRVGAINTRTHNFLAKSYRWPATEAQAQPYNATKKKYDIGYNSANEQFSAHTSP
jgi:hypothetical protein